LTAGVAKTERRSNFGVELGTVWHYKQLGFFSGGHLMNSTAAAPQVSGDLYKKVFWRLIPLLLLCYFVAYLDRINVGFAKLQMLADLQFSETVYGLGAGIFFIGYVVFEVPANLILMRIGARIWLAIILASFGIISSATIFVQDAMTFYILRFLLGVAEAGFIPAVLFYLTLWFPSAHRGKASALFLAGIPLAGAIGAPLSGWIMHAFNGDLGMAGWKWVFLLEGSPAVLLGLTCWFYLDNSVEKAKWLNDAEKEQIKRDLAADSSGAGLHSIRDGLLSGRVWLLSGTYFFLTLGLYGISFWLPSIIRDTGVQDPLDIGLLSAVPYIGGLFSMYFVGRSSDKMKERRWHLALCAVAGSIGLVLSVTFANNTTLALAALTIAAMGITPCIPQFYTLVPAVASGAAAAMAIAVANSVGSISGFVAPYMIGYVKDTTGSTAAGLLVISAALIVGGALVFANPAKLVNR